MISIEVECNCGKKLEIEFDWFPSEDQMEDAEISVLRTCPRHEAWRVEVKEVIAK